MSKPIRIDFVADVAQYLREVKKVEVSTEDIADALVDASNDAQDLQRKLEKAMRESEKDVEGLSRVIKDLPKATDKAADGAKRDFDRIGDEAADSGKEAGRSFAGNLGEGLSSGDIGSVLQDTIGDLVSEVSGPASAAVAVGAAIALAVWNEFAQNEEAKNRAREGLFSAFDELTGELDKRQAIRAGIEELGGGEFSQGLLDAKKYADALNLSTAEYAELVSGQVNPRTKDTVAALEAQVTELETLKQVQDGLSPAQEAYLDAAKETLGTTKLQQGALVEAAAAQGFWNDTQEQTGLNAQELKETLADAVDEAARIGTGNDELDALLEKAQDLGWDLLSNQEKAKLIGSGNEALDDLAAAAQDVETALGNAKGYAGSFPDPGMPQARADAASIRASMEAAAAAAARIKLPNANIPLTASELTPYASKGQ